jgi:hypothetical protein
MNPHPAPVSSPQLRIVFLVLLAVIGCGGNKNEFEVSGTVRYQGQPLPTGTVSFLDSSNQWLASSAINDGTYAIRGKMPDGPVKITVTTLGSSSGGPHPFVLRKKKSREPLMVIPIPAKYGSADQSGLTYTVQPGANEYNIDLQ